MKARVLMAIFMLGMFTGNAMACDVSSSFSQSPAIVLPQFAKNDAAIMDDLRSDMDVPVRGRDLCAGFPDDSQATLVFMENRLVQIKLRSEGQAGLLLNFAEDKFGKITQKPDIAKSSNSNFQHVWDVSDNLLAMYSLGKHRGKPTEYLEFTAKKERKTMEKFFALEEEEINKSGKSNKGNKLKKK